MANILIYSNNPHLIADCTHTLVAEHHVSRLLNIHNDFVADAVIIDAHKLNDDSKLLSLLSSKNTRFLVVGENWPNQQQIDALVHGASGYCESTEIATQLSRAVDNALKGDVWIRRCLVPKVIEALSGKRQLQVSQHAAPKDIDQLIDMADSLSAREMEVADMIRQGENNKSIAHILNISERTVKAHLSSIFRKFEVDDRLHLAICLKEIDRYR